MATNTFERKIKLDAPNSIKRIMDITNSRAPEKPLSLHPFSDKERSRSEKLLKQCLSRSKQ